MKRLAFKEDYVFLNRQMFILSATLNFMTTNIGDYYDALWRELRSLRNEFKKLKKLVEKIPNFSNLNLSYEFDHKLSARIETNIQTQDKFSEQVYGHLACYRNCPLKFTRHFKSEARKRNVKLYI